MKGPVLVSYLHIAEGMKSHPNHEYFREKMDRNDRFVFCIKFHYNPTKGHVDGSSEERGRDQDQHCLDDVWTKCCRAEV